MPSIYGKIREKILCPLFWLPTEKPGRRNLSWFTSEFRLFFRQQWCILFQHPPCGFLRVSLDKTHGHWYLLSVTWVIKPAASSNSHVQSEEGDSTLQSWCISETMREMITKLWFLLKCISHLYFVFVYFGAAEASSCSPIVLNRYRPQTSRPVSQCCLFSYNKQDESSALGTISCSEMILRGQVRSCENLPCSAAVMLKMGEAQILTSDYSVVFKHVCWPGLWGLQKNSNMREEGSFHVSAMSGQQCYFTFNKYLNFYLNTDLCVKAVSTPLIR